MHIYIYVYVTYTYVKLRVTCCAKLSKCSPGQIITGTSRGASSRPVPRVPLLLCHLQAVKSYKPLEPREREPSLPNKP